MAIQLKVITRYIPLGVSCIRLKIINFNISSISFFDGVRPPTIFHVRFISPVLLGVLFLSVVPFAGVEGAVAALWVDDLWDGVDSFCGVLDVDLLE